MGTARDKWVSLARPHRWCTWTLTTLLSLVGEVISREFGHSLCHLKGGTHWQSSFNLLHRFKIRTYICSSVMLGSPLGRMDFNKSSLISQGTCLCQHFPVFHPTMTCSNGIRFTGLSCSAACPVVCQLQEVQVGEISAGSLSVRCSVGIPQFPQRHVSSWMDA